MPVPKFSVSTLINSKVPLDAYKFEDVEVGNDALDEDIVTPVPIPKFKVSTLINLKFPLDEVKLEVIRLEENKLDE